MTCEMREGSVPCSLSRPTARLFRPGARSRVKSGMRRKTREFHKSTKSCRFLICSNKCGTGPGKRQVPGLSGVGEGVDQPANTNLQGVFLVPSCTWALGPHGVHPKLMLLGAPQQRPSSASRAGFNARTTSALGAKWDRGA